MRTRTLLAAAALAVLTMAWSAPAAMAKGDDDTGSTTTTTSAPAPKATTAKSDSDTVKHPTTLRADTSSTEPEPPHTTTHKIPPPPAHGPTHPAPPTVTTLPAPPTSHPAPPTSSAPASHITFPPIPSSITASPIPSDPHAVLSVSPSVVRPGDSISANAHCVNGEERSLSGDQVSFSGHSGHVDSNAHEGMHSVTLECVNGPKRDTASASFRVDRNGQGDHHDLRATLSVSPHVVRQGEVVYFNGGCDNGHQVRLDADGVDVRGNRGYVPDDAREGEHSATRVCSDGHHEVSATDHFRVIGGDHHGDGPGPWDFWLSDRSGFRGDSVDASVRCRDNTARLESDALDDITLHRDGGRLVGTTRVVDHVSSGWHKVTVSCDGHSESVGFWVLFEHGDHEAWLSLDPGYGHRGDEIDVHVGCDREVGRLESDALNDIDLDRDGRPWRYSGTTHVTSDAEPGEHRVRIRCGGDTLEEWFFVKSDGDHDDSGTPGGGDLVSVYPKGAPETGGGPVDSPASGPNWGLLAVTGLGAVAVAGGGVALARRKASREVGR